MLFLGVLFMKSPYYFLILLLVFFLFIYSSSIIASDISFGGQIDASLMAYKNIELGFSFLPQANLDVELFLPAWSHYEIKCEGYFFTDIAKEKVSFFWKKLYWKNKFEKLHISIGRQPISWSFGSLLNPVDYTLGAVALDRDNNSKYQNALEVYFPINWNTSLSFIASIPNNSNDLKMGIRGRTLINDFDVTVHFIQEQFTSTKEGQQRLGLTAKGDLGPFGIYSALGIYRKKELSFSFLTGLDYSYFFQAGNQLYFQIEYINMPPEVFSQITGSLLIQEEKVGDENINLLVNHSSYQIDEFSSISLTSLSNFNEGSNLIISEYSNQFNTNTTFRVQAGMMIESKQDLNLSTLKSFFNRSPNLFIDLGINYSF